MFFISLCFMALLENALNQTGNDTHPSYARCSPRYLGVSLCGKYISCKPMEETEIVATVSLARLPQRDMVCLCWMPLCENTLNQTGNITHLSCARFPLGYLDWSLGGQSKCGKPMEQTENIANLSRRVPQRLLVCFCCMAVSGNTLKQTWNITHLSFARFPLRHLDVRLCGESKCGKPTKQTASLLISYGLMITLTSYLVLLLFSEIRGYNRTSLNHLRRLG